jgi:hypothetical protein
MAGISMRPMASPLSGCLRITLVGGSISARLSCVCSRCATTAETGSCQRRVTVASVMSSVPLTIITDAKKRRTARMVGQCMGAAG